MMKIADDTKKKHFARWCIKTGNIPVMRGGVDKKALEQFRQKPYYCTAKGEKNGGSD